ncbi:MAG: hypothetical protein GX429_00630 [Bacteroidales bacterium]|nr:hypothetical protein [Bacteroidales bacterium]
MKYFTNKLWQQLNDENNDIRIEAEKQWNDNANLYSKVYNEVKSKLPKKFIIIYEKEHGFHDWQIKNINIIQSDTKTKTINIEIAITNSSKSYIISYKKIKIVKIGYQYDNLIERGFDDWGYSEFLPFDDESISNEILFASGVSIFICFKKIYIKRLK